MDSNFKVTPPLANSANSEAPQQSLSTPKKVLFLVLALVFYVSWYFLFMHKSYSPAAPDIPSSLAPVATSISPWSPSEVVSRITRVSRLSAAVGIIATLLVISIIALVACAVYVNYRQSHVEEYQSTAYVESNGSATLFFVALSFVLFTVVGLVIGLQVGKFFPKNHSREYEVVIAMSPSYPEVTRKSNPEFESASQSRELASTPVALSSAALNPRASPSNPQRNLRRSPAEGVALGSELSSTPDDDFIDSELFVGSALPESYPPKDATSASNYDTSLGVIVQ